MHCTPHALLNAAEQASSSTELKLVLALLQQSLSCTRNLQAHVMC
jgi:hypothetical protein